MGEAFSGKAIGHSAANACWEEVLGTDDQPHWKVDAAPRRVFGERTNPSLVV
jgi:hypothetical protein